ncbi:hypothetical protein AHAS_Ahas13G0262500 [Arachis hypogaea]
MEIPARDPNKYASKYYELHCRHFRLKKKPHFERILQMYKLPPDLRWMVNEHIETRGWGFLERQLRDVNENWVLEFYVNFYFVTLKSVLL